MQLFILLSSMTDKMIERKLLFKVRTQKDKQAFGKLYDLYVEKIYRFVYFKISNKEESEDLTSEVFLKTWNYLMENTDTEIVSFSGLIYRITRNKIIDHLLVKEVRAYLIYKVRRQYKKRYHLKYKKISKVLKDTSIKIKPCFHTNISLFIINFLILYLKAIKAFHAWLLKFCF